MADKTKPSESRFQRKYSRLSRKGKLLWLTFCVVFGQSSRFIRKDKIHSFFVIFCKTYGGDYSPDAFDKAIKELEAVNFIKIQEDHEITYADIACLKVRHENEDLKIGFSERFSGILKEEGCFKEMVDNIFNLIGGENYESACREGERLLQDKENIEKIPTKSAALLLNRLCQAYRRKGDIDNAKKKASECLEYCEDHSLEETGYMCWTEIGLIYFYENSFPEYLACENNAKRLLDMNKKDKLGGGLISDLDLGRLYGELAYASVLNKEFKDAENYLEEMKKYYTEEADPMQFEYNETECMHTGCILRLAQEDKTREETAELYKLIAENRARYENKGIGSHTYARGVVICDIAKGFLLNEEARKRKDKNKLAEAGRVFDETRKFLKKQHFKEILMQAWIDEGLKGKVFYELLSEPNEADKIKLKAIEDEVRGWRFLKPGGKEPGAEKAEYARMWINQTKFEGEPINERESNELTESRKDYNIFIIDRGEYLEDSVGEVYFNDKPVSPHLVDIEKVKTKKKNENKYLTPLEYRLLFYALKHKGVAGDLFTLIKECWFKHNLANMLREMLREVISGKRNRVEFNESTSGFRKSIGELSKFLYDHFKSELRTFKTGKYRLKPIPKFCVIKVI